MKLESIQQEVTQLYYNHLKGYQGGLNLSRPHVPLISEAYLKNRIIILGQETNSWYRQGNDDLYNYYLKNYTQNDPYYGTEPYRKFIRDSVEKYPGKFWEFARTLYNQGLIRGPIQKDGFLGHCWINLFSVEAIPTGNVNHLDIRKGRPTNNGKLLENVVNLQTDLLFNLVKILKPKIVIALTGPKLDHVLLIRSLNLNYSNDEFKKVAIDSNNIFSEKQLGEIRIENKTHPLFGARIIRTYHPSYFMGRINSVKKFQKGILNNSINGTVSFYYQSLISNWLKENIKDDESLC